MTRRAPRVATGFAPSMEEANPDVRVLPDRVDNQDLDLEDDIRTVLRNNSETGHLADVQVARRERRGSLVWDCA